VDANSTTLPFTASQVHVSSNLTPEFLATVVSPTYRSYILRPLIGARVSGEWLLAPMIDKAVLGASWISAKANRLTTGGCTGHNWPATLGQPLFLLLVQCHDRSSLSHTSTVKQTNRHGSCSGTTAATCLWAVTLDAFTTDESHWHAESFRCQRRLQRCSGSTRIRTRRCSQHTFQKTTNTRSSRPGSLDFRPAITKQEHGLRHVRRTRVSGHEC